MGITIRRGLMLAAASAALSACATYHDVEEIKLIGFTPDVSQGKSSGMLDADDCVFHVAGYWLGTYPDVSRAIDNARTGKKGKVTDVVQDSGAGSSPIRYANNVTAKPGGFNAYIFGKHCIEVKGMGYK